MKYLWELVRRCPYCGSSTVRRSQRQNLFEFVVLPLFLLRPYRCQARDLACSVTAERSGVTKKRKGRRAQKVLTVKELEKILRRAAKISQKRGQPAPPSH